MYKHYLEADPNMEFGIARMLAWPKKNSRGIGDDFSIYGDRVVEVERFPDTPEVVLERFRMIT